MNRKYYIIAILLAFGPLSVSAQVAAGGSFTLEKSVAGAGGASSNGGFSVTGTAGQAAAGTTAGGGPFSQPSGFWIPDQLAPTAAGVTVGGRVTTADGRGIRNARVTLVGADGILRSVATGTFGHFRLTDVEAGGTYVLSVSAKRFSFTVPTQIVTVVDHVLDLSFVADNE